MHLSMAVDLAVLVVFTLAFTALGSWLFSRIEI